MLRSRQHLHGKTWMQHKLIGGVRTATSCSVIAFMNGDMIGEVYLTAAKLGWGRC